MHTPGPWTAEWSDKSPTVRILGANKRPICGVPVFASLGGDEDVANSRLISSAPGLLLACEDALKAIENNLPDELLPCTRKMLGNVIAEATGALL